MFSICFALQYVVSFLVLQSLDEEGRASCITLIVFPMSSRCLVTVSVLCSFRAMSWVGLLCVIVVFPDYTQLLFKAESIEQFCSE